MFANFLISKQKLVLKVVLCGITQVLCYLIKYEKNKQLISRYKYPFLKIFYRKVTRLFVRRNQRHYLQTSGSGGQPANVNTGLIPTVLKKLLFFDILECFLLNKRIKI